MHSRTRPFRLLGLMGVLGTLLLAAGSPVAAAKPPPRPAAGPGTNHATDDPFTASRTSWWRQARFGMFIHFGAYSNLEGEYTRPDGTVCRNAEWIKRECGIPDEAYEKQAAAFNPSAFDAEAIVRAAKDAGQRYIVITSKHHDGYAMWPTKQNTWNLRDHSSFDPHRDILAELKKAADAAGIKLGFYYSIWDWHDRTSPTRRPSRATRSGCTPSSRSSSTPTTRRFCGSTANGTRTAPPTAGPAGTAPTSRRICTV